MPFLDASRGIVMVLMALDHAVFFAAKAHPLEYWGRPLPEYENLFWFLTRVSSHLCAPGFFFLMGIGMALFAASRRRRGWSENRIMRHFLARGLLLVVIQQFVINPAWFLGTMGSAAILGHAGPPGGGGAVYVNLDVLFCLGTCLMALSLLLRANQVVVLGLSLGAVLMTQIWTPSPDQVDTIYSPWIRMLSVPGQTGFLLVAYPLVPWLGLGGLGMVFGRMILRNRERTVQILSAAGVGSLLLFLLLRGIGGFGNFHPPGEGGLISFLNLTKYPPSLAFVALYLGVNMVLLWILAKSETAIRAPRWLLTFGRTPLFFYTVHLYTYAAFGALFPKGAGLGATYAVWLAGLLLLYPLCARYERFKQGTPPDSPWRYF